MPHTQLSLSQHAYIDTLLHHFNLKDCKPLAQPLDPHIQLSVDQCPTTIKEKPAMKAVLYQKAVGALNWVAVGMRPNIVFEVGQLVRFMENPGHVHWEAVKHVLQYLKSMWDWRLVYGGAESHGLEGFMDANGAISWCLKKQELVTLSTAEAEYITATHTTKELIWFRCLLGKIFQPLKHPILFILTVSLPLHLLILRGSFMPEQNILTFGGILSTTRLKMALSSSYIVLPRT